MRHSQSAEAQPLTAKAQGKQVDQNRVYIVKNESRVTTSHGYLHLQMQINITSVLNGSQSTIVTLSVTQ